MISLVEEMCAYTHFYGVCMRMFISDSILRCAMCTYLILHSVVFRSVCNILSNSKIVTIHEISNLAYW